LLTRLMSGRVPVRKKSSMRKISLEEYGKKRMVKKWNTNFAQNSFPQQNVVRALSA
jgi:hypothetical protein